MLNFEGSGDKLMAVATKKDPINPNAQLIYYLTGFGGLKYPPAAKAFYLSSLGLFTVNKLTKDAQHNYIAFI